MKALLALTLATLLAPIGLVTAEPGPPITETYCVENLGGRYNLPSGLPPTDGLGLLGWVLESLPIMQDPRLERTGTREFIGVPGQDYGFGRGALGWNFTGFCTALGDILDCVKNLERCIDADRAWVEEHNIHYWGEAPITITDLTGTRIVTADEFMQARL